MELTNSRPVNTSMGQSNQGRYWLLTIPHEMFEVPEVLDCRLQCLHGQLERGGGGYLHWQLLAAFKKKTRLGGVKSIFGQQCHCELSRSSAADAYVFKEATRVDGTQFELGERAFKRNSPTDWDLVRTNCRAGKFDLIPGDVYVRYYGNLRKIYSDHAKPMPIVRTCRVFVGPTGTGKSRLAWEEAGTHAYIKNPTTKWWCGYQGNLYYYQVKRMLLSMNLEEISEYPTCYDGSIDILSYWKSKVVRSPLKQKSSGSVLTSVQENGTPDLMRTPIKP